VNTNVAKPQIVAEAANIAYRLAAILSARPYHECPICGRVGQFLPEARPFGDRPLAKCPRCGSLERHRLQKLTLDRISDGSWAIKRGLQFAPDPVSPVLRRLLKELVTADLEPHGDSIRLDMRALDLPDACFDVVFASHVLEHIDDDIRAMHEVKRILKPGGIAILPVPIFVDKTIEYGVPALLEDEHMRAPGLDYFDRYRSVFDRVDVYTSKDFPEKYQLWDHDDRTLYPRPEVPLRTPMAGPRHLDAVPVCYKA
jgi:SAM-dependent methyltransferase